MLFSPKNMVVESFSELKQFFYAPVEKIAQYLLAPGKRARFLTYYHNRRKSSQPLIVSAIQHIIDQNREARALIIFTPTLDWNQQLFQRPQQLARALAKRGALVFYTHVNNGKNSISQIENRLFDCKFPLEIISELPASLVYAVTWNTKYLIKFNQPEIIYDYLDDVTAFAGNTTLLQKKHQSMLASARLVITSARNLLSEVIPSRPDALLVPNGVDISHFDPLLNPEIMPAEMEKIRADGKAIIGYYGALANWFDYELMMNLVILRPDLNFVLIGPDHDGSFNQSQLQTQSNVFYLGTKPYTDLPAYLAGFDIAILPFKLNQITHATSPLKVFEYMAGGKPIISTPLNEITYYPVIQIAETYNDFSDRINEALPRKNSPELMEVLIRTAKENTWEARAEEILRAIEKLSIESQLTREPAER